MMPEANPTTRKWRCKHCGGMLPCKPCTRLRQQAWADAKRERVREQKAAYEARYPDRVKASKLAWYQRNKEAAIARLQDRRANNRDAERARYREQYAKDATPFLIRARRRDERNLAVGGSFTLADKCTLFQSQGGICANPFCQADLSVTGFHADHKTPVLLGGSHNSENRQLLCPTCNHRKGSLTNEEWLARQGRVSA